MNVVWSPLAVQRVSEMAEEIALDRPVVAGKWVEDIFDAAERLKTFPDSGRMVPELQRAEVREVIHRGSRIIYRVEEGCVLILTVRHSRQLTEPDHLR